MKKTIFLFLLFTASLFSCSSEKKQNVKEDLEIMEVTGIVSSYNDDVLCIRVLRTGMDLPLKWSEKTTMNFFPAPKDTVLLIYTGDLGDMVHLPVISEIKARRYVEKESKVVDLESMKDNELITKP